MNAIERTRPETKLLKRQFKETWIAGDFGRIARTSTDQAEEFIEGLNLQRGTRVLDIACGTGNLSIPAARRGAVVTAVDSAPHLLDEAAKRAAAENLEIRFDEGEIDLLPYRNQSFDVVISMFGAMFAPRPDRVVAELFRVCRPGGSIAMANWTSRGFVGQLYRLAGLHLPAPEDYLSPFLWGDIARLASLFGGAVSDLCCRRRTTTLNFPFGARKTVAYWSRHYLPTRGVFELVDETEQEQLRRKMERLFTSNDVSKGGGETLIEAEYLEAVVTLKS
jgi:ubiquinone/menaquinone biosynthesis C-methylase UbiE